VLTSGIIDYFTAGAGDTRETRFDIGNPEGTNTGFGCNPDPDPTSNVGAFQPVQGWSWNWPFKPPTNGLIPGIRRSQFPRARPERVNDGETHLFTSLVSNWV